MCVSAYLGGAVGVRVTEVRMPVRAKRGARQSGERVIFRIFANVWKRVRVRSKASPDHSALCFFVLSEQ